MGLHNIRRISVEVNHAGKVNGLALLEETSVWANETLVAQVRQVFESLPEFDQHIQIARLEIELNPTSGNWRLEILPRLQLELTALLLDKITTETNDLKSDEKLRPEESFFRDLVFFLKQGVLPWASEIRSRDDWERAFLQWLSSVDVAHYKSQLIDALREPGGRTRFVQSLSPSVLRKVVIILFDVPERIWDDWLVAAKRLPWTMTGESLVEAVVDHGFTYEPDLESEIVTRTLAELIRQQRINSMEAEPPGFESITKRDGPTSIDAIKPRIIRPLAPPEGRESPAAAEGIYVLNAGIVLLAPFLSTFFDRAGVAKNRQLLDPGTAIALIHYLATGEENPAEFQLVLPKILCGWEIEQVIEVPNGLSERMKDEAGQLLSSAIEHWSILKNTSREGLQESFLQRQGKLTLTESGDWLLLVEQKPYDMLLQHLPWSFQFTKLPWMNRLLRTDWVF